MFWKLFSTEKLHLRVLKSPVRLKFKPHLIASWVPTKDYYIPMKSFYFWDLQGQVKQASIPNIPRIRLNVKPEILNYSKTYIYFKNILVLANKDLSVKQIERIMSSKRRRSLAQQGFQNYFYNNCLISRALIGSFLSSIRVQRIKCYLWKLSNIKLSTFFKTNEILWTFLKGHCHENFAVLGQFCAKIITWKL